MIKFLKNTPDGPYIGLGLSQGNIRLLKEGKPILVNLEDLGLPPGKIVIFYGQTEEDMLTEMRPNIGPKTKLIGVE